uniref:Uncharacterized protein n=1 Tax=Grammatophora oceanica TaxID=210454 RepID=A0A7S1VCT6_9STRA|mmetsp:Transcript_43157/g.64010  ORF Transcript_43157/g.64010 Transcript_43157/m.64010 type:complete len:125 (+) Transcript_43157:56-430(+)
MPASRHLTDKTSSCHPLYCRSDHTSNTLYHDDDDDEHHIHSFVASTICRSRIGGLQKPLMKRGADQEREVQDIIRFRMLLLKMSANWCDDDDDDAHQQDDRKKVKATYLLTYFVDNGKPVLVVC